MAQRRLRAARPHTEDSAGTRLAMVGTFSTGLLKAGLERGGEGAINERRVSSLEGRSAESVPTDLRAPKGARRLSRR